MYLIIFELRDRFWTLWDGPLDPLDRYKNHKKTFFGFLAIFQNFAYKPIVDSLKSCFEHAKQQILACSFIWYQYHYIATDIIPTYGPSTYYIVVRSERARERARSF